MKFAKALPNYVRKYGVALIILAYLLEFVFETWTIKVPVFKVHNFINGLINGHPFSLETAMGYVKHEGIGNTMNSILAAVGVWLLVFSEEKTEDEYIAKLRLESFYWAGLVNTFLIIIFSLTLFDEDFLYSMIFEMYAIPLLAFLRFKYVLFKNNSQLKANREL